MGEHEATELLRRVERSIERTRELAARFDRAHLVPIRDQRHLSHTADYMLRRERRHEVSLDPAARAAICPLSST